MGASVNALAVSLLLLVPALDAQRRPRGIYAVVNVAEQIDVQTTANPSITRAQLEAYFLNLYQQLFSNPAVSGIAIYENWATLNPNAPPAANAYDWTYMDDLFAQAAAWNLQNPAQAPKNVQLVVSPGFQTPAWVMTQIPNCDGMLRLRCSRYCPTAEPPPPPGTPEECTPASTVRNVRQTLLSRRCQCGLALFDHQCVAVRPVASGECDDRAPAVTANSARRFKCFPSTSSALGPRGLPGPIRTRSWWTVPERQSR